MAESSSHIRLVEEMVNWIAATYLNGEKAYLLIDHPDSPTNNKPPKINGYIPDIFSSISPLGGVIIGEAKTINDIERVHTEEQIKAYLRYCKDYNNAIFVFAVPWQMSRFANAFIKRLQDQTGSSLVNINVIKGLLLG